MVCVAFAAVTASVRDSLGVATIALLLASVTVATAFGDWLAGLVTSVVAALSLNYFHTAPVHSLRVTSGSDIGTIAALMVIGTGTAAASAWTVRRRVVRHQSVDAQLAAIRLVDSVGRSRPASELWADALASMSSELSLIDARLEPSGSLALPHISRSRQAEASGDDGRVVIPPGGAVLTLSDPRLMHELVLTPRNGLGSIAIERSAVFQFADSIESAVSRGTLTL